LVPFKLGPHIYNLWRQGRLLIQGVWALAVCRCGKPIVSGILGCNRWPVVPRVMTPIVAPEPSVEQVVRADHSTVGRIVLTLYSEDDRGSLKMARALSH
jgi:hypothetical protein